MTETDQELLELAAKAAGYLETSSVQDGFGFIALVVMDADGDWTGQNWNPLTDDGDALRLAVKLHLLNDRRFLHERDVLMFTKNMPRLEATRRAFVRAAAEIGRNMRTKHEQMLCQNKSMGAHACTNRHQCWEPCGELGHSAEHARVSERNFCERCGKRLRDIDSIHTCTPPDDRSPEDRFCDKYCVMTDHHPICKYAPATGGNV